MNKCTNQNNEFKMIRFNVDGSCKCERIENRSCKQCSACDVCGYFKPSPRAIIDSFPNVVWWM